MKTYSRILVGKYLLPGDISASASSLISGLLQVSPPTLPLPPPAPDPIVPLDPIDPNHTAGARPPHPAPPTLIPPPCPHTLISTDPDPTLIPEPPWPHPGPTLASPHPGPNAGRRGAAAWLLYLLLTATSSSYYSLPTCYRSR